MERSLEQSTNPGIRKSLNGPGSLKGEDWKTIYWVAIEWVRNRGDKCDKISAVLAIVLSPLQHLIEGLNLGRIDHPTIGVMWTERN